MKIYWDADAFMIIIISLGLRIYWKNVIGNIFRCKRKLVKSTWKFGKVGCKLLYTKYTNFVWYYVCMYVIFTFGHRYNVEQFETSSKRKGVNVMCLVIVCVMLHFFAQPLSPVNAVGCGKKIHTLWNVSLCNLVTFTGWTGCPCSPKCNFSWPKSNTAPCRCWHGL